MSPASKPDASSTDRQPVDVSSWPAKLTEQGPIQTPEVLGPQDLSTPRRRHSSWHRPGGIALLCIGLVIGTLLVLHGINASKHQTLNSANQTDNSLGVKSQTIPLSNLGLTPLNTLSQMPDTLTVNGNVNVADSVVLQPIAEPSGAVAGQLYYDQQRNQLGYYDGGSFIYLQGGNGSVINNVHNVYNVNNVSNVTNVSNISGNNISGTSGDIAMFTGGTSLGNSLLNQSGSDLSTTGSMSIGTVNPGISRLSVVGSTSDNTTNVFDATNSSGDSVAQFSDSGQVNLGISPGAAFGNTTIEPAADNGINGIISADKFTTTGSVIVQSMSVYTGGVGSYPNNQFQLGIYADSGGAPGAWVASSSIGTLVANSWNTLPISAHLAAGTTYWLAYTTSSANPSQDDPYLAGSLSATHAYAAFVFNSGSQNGLPSSYPTPTTVNNFTHSIYASTTGTNSAVIVDASGTLTAVGPAVFEDRNVATNAFQVQNSSGSAVFDVDTFDGNIGVGTSTPTTARVSVVGATNDNTTNALSVTSNNGNTLQQLSDDGSVKLGLSYPVFGNNSSGNFTGAGYFNSGFELMQAQSFTTTSGGTLRSISTYIGQPISPTNNLYQMAIYNNVSNAPNTYIASTTVGTLTNSGWNTLPIVATLAANTTYWLVYWTNVTDSNHNGQNFISNYSGPNRFYQGFAVWQSGASNGMPTAFPPMSASGGTFETSIYATFASPISALTLDSSGNLTENGATLIQSSSSDALQVTDSTGSTALYVDGGSHFVGVNTNNTGGFNFVVQGTAAFGGVNNSTALKIANASNVTLLNADTSNQILTIGSATTALATLELDNAHFNSVQTTAPLISVPANCGTSPSAAVTAGATDAAGSFSITAGTGAVTGPCSVTLSFNQAYTSIPKSVLITPTTAIGTSPQGKSAVVSAVTANSFTVTLPTNPAASEVDSYYYWVVQ